ncbi:MAG: glycosyltransferase family 4 protein [Candidatus Moranbacteria bacterium]|nr:glycosyltransferase family 4 protein [Candidatus Moranbacteria bacterium]
MKLLIVAPDFYPTNGGYANAISNFFDCLSRDDSNIQITVFTPTPIGSNVEIQRNNVLILRFPFNRALMPFKVWEIVAYFKIRKFLKKNAIDVVFFETAEFGLLGYLLSISFKKVLVRIHACTETEVAIWGTRLYDKIHSFFIKLFLKKVKWILSTNSYHLGFYKKYFLMDDVYKIASKVFFVVPNTVVADPGNEQLTIRAVRETELFPKYEIFLKQGQRIFFGLGRLNRVGLMQKGFEDLIYAVSFIKTEDEYLYNKIKIVLVGDGECRKYITNLINKLELSEAFVIISKMEHKDVLAFMHESSATMLFSRFEGLSMFALEALHSGSPLLFARSGGISDLIGDSGNGHLTDPQDIDGIKDGIKKILRSTEGEIEEMRKKSRSHFNENYASEKTIKKFINIINLVNKCY